MTFSFVINTPPLSLSRSFSPCAITGIHKNAKRFSKDTNSSAHTFRNIADHFTLDSNYGGEAKKDQKKEEKKIAFPNSQRAASVISDCQIPRSHFTSKTHLSLIEPYCLPLPDFTVRSTVLFFYSLFD